MRFSLFVLIASMIVVSFLITYFVLKYTLKQHIVDIPNERSSHATVTPRGGGMGFVIVFLLSLCVLLYMGLIGLNTFLALVGGGLLIAAVGWKDDKAPVSPLVRAVYHFLAAAWAVYWLGGFSMMNIGFAKLQLSWIGSVVAVIGAVWMINLYNFMDGVDGIAGTEAVIVVAICGLLLLCQQSFSLAIVCFLLAASVIGFLLWNWPPAKIFMGDVGSGFLGFVFACLAIASENTGAMALIIWILLLGVFVIDATCTLILRVSQGNKWYEAHRSHVYQLAVQAGYSHKQVTLTVLAINCGLGAIAYWVLRVPQLLLPVSLATAVIFVIAHNHLRKYFMRFIEGLNDKSDLKSDQSFIEAATTSDSK